MTTYTSVALSGAECCRLDLRARDKIDLTQSWTSVTKEVSEIPIQTYFLFVLLRAPMVVSVAVLTMICRPSVYAHWIMRGRPVRKVSAEYHKREIQLSLS
ncbi:hypothetical protein T265_08756 [Opisthorchis viverrini]|uniref:Uncharacterized protein n=1 Tax=Opisthorchis viverrini TaxID=6198 RepID=A0A075A7B8_OPIVI|nr:hypothetical protein T265_08756 [Opisthorchis viverrini]KER23344.1 hypothetical protein T265_08756 [Opisthorchis viverrini]